MPAIDTEAQFKFLLCCIKHSAAGKVNFDNVANELNIVSKAAAAKRYERLLKAHDINPNTPRKGKGAQNGDGDDDVKTPASKKRKRGGAATKKNESDDDETPVKKDRSAIKKAEDDDEKDIKVKGEGEGSCYPSTSTTPASFRGTGGE
ncbi:hypothetical protein NEMBOFW57_009719 [Staphylotrichum longicolle]|uniref:Myb-like DNA-binding domain-containing protein n=1 Tax=Staphylotrichum longicolle TaxID=669026 RepID=A0AAD4EPW4_9PEZI|nr:hypothetical protein NEMBOFW57_009719 [Staphylotrichum longicolle]